MEKKRKIPQRKCVGCGERRDKGELCRIVKTPDGGVCLDKTAVWPDAAHICAGM